MDFCVSHRNCAFHVFLPHCLIPLSFPIFAHFNPPTFDVLHLSFGSERMLIDWLVIPGPPAEGESEGIGLFFCLHSEELIEKLFNYRGISFLLLIRYSDTNNIPPLWNEIMRNSKMLSQKRLQKWNLSWKTLESMPASEEWKEIDKNSYQGLLYYLFTLTRDYLDTGKNWCRWIRLKNPSLMQIIKQDI